MEHTCAANGDNHRVFHVQDFAIQLYMDGKWHLSGGWVISFCPYCGEKLESPDVKIEVSQKMLEEIASDLREIRRHLWGSPGEASSEILNIIVRIREILDD